MLFQSIIKWMTPVALVWAALNVLLYFRQPGMVFFPDHDLVQTPADWGLDYQDVSLQTSDKIKLHAWFLPNKNSRRLLIFFHGNAGNISHRGESARIFHALGLNVLMPDYRGYGRSEGSASEHGLYTDAMAAWEYARKTLGYVENDIIVFGRSLGGAVATHLAAEANPAGLILESTFSSARDMAQQQFSFFAALLYVRYGFNSAQKITRVKSPVLVLHSPEDEIIPFELGEKVFAAATGRKIFVRLSGPHNGGFLMDRQAYRKALADFLSEI